MTHPTPSLRRLRPVAIALAAACAALAANGASAGAPASAPAAASAAPQAGARAARPAALAVPQLPLRVRTLANGLQVVQVRTPDAANASVQVWYRTGSKDDPPGRSGFAHLFEHLMFKSTKYLPAESFDRLTEDVGGANNAFTADDTTAYHEVIPPNHVERLLWAEAERMSRLTVDEANFRSERKVVEEELRQRVLASPYGRFFNAIPKAGYLVHPYKRPGIGSIEDLEAASLEDVRAFYRTYYRPDNAVLIVTGPTDPSLLDAWVDKYFGPLTHPATPVPRVTVKEPKRTDSPRVAVTGPNVPLPAIGLLWQGPAKGAHDAAALRVAAALLGDGDASRLHEALVVRRRLTANVGFDAELNKDAGLLIGYGIAASGQSLADIDAALQAEAKRLADGPIPPAELEKVRTRLVTAALVDRQTPLGQGMAIGDAVIMRGDPAGVNRDLPELQAVTAADVQRVLRQYVVGRPHATVEYTQAKAPEAPAAAASSAMPAQPPAPASSATEPKKEAR
jgi:zinc protease